MRRTPADQSGEVGEDLQMSPWLPPFDPNCQIEKNAHLIRFENYINSSLEVLGLCFGFNCFKPWSGEKLDLFWRRNKIFGCFLELIPAAPAICMFVSVSCLSV